MSTLKDQVGSFLYGDYKLGSFWALAKSLDSIEEFSRILGSIQLPESSHCGMVRSILSGVSIPASYSNLPSRIFKKIQEELATYYPRLFPENSYIVLKSSELPSFNINPKEDSLVLSIEWLSVDMKTSAILIDKLCSLSNYQLRSFVFTNGIYYTSLSMRDNAWVIHDISGPSQELRLEDALRFMVLRNMYPVMVFYRKSSHSPCSKTLIYNIAKQVDELLNFQPLNIEKEDNSWVCNHCNLYVDNAFYECNKCAMINWPRFYEIKSKKIGSNVHREYSTKPYRSPLINTLYTSSNPQERPSMSTEEIKPTFSLEQEDSPIYLIANRNSEGSYRQPTRELSNPEDTDSGELSPVISNRLRIPGKEMALSFSPSKSAMGIRSQERSEPKAFIQRRQKREFTFGNK